MRITHGLGLVGTLALLVSLAACTADPIAAFNREQEPQDLVTGLRLEDRYLAELDLGSTRFEGTTSGGIDVFVAKGKGDATCLLLVGDGDEMFQGCGSRGLMVGTEGPSVTVWPGGTRDPNPDDWTELSESVWILER